MDVMFTDIELVIVYASLQLLVVFYIFHTALDGGQVSHEVISLTH